MSALTQYTYDSNPDIIFNDNTTDPDNWYKLLSLLLDTEVRNVEDSDPEQGIIDYDSTLGKGLIEGRVALFAEDIANLNLLVQNLKKAFNPILTELNSESDEGFLPLKWTMVLGVDSYNVQVYAKPVEIPKIVLDENGAGGVARILMKAKDPIKVSQTQKTVTLTTAAATGTDTNDGDMPAYPTITITGPTNASPRITNQETGEYIEINDTLAGGEVYVIDTREATILKDGVNAYSAKTAASTFFNLRGGDVTLIATNLGASGQAAVVYRDAWTL